MTTANATGPRFKITSGPCKFDLITSQYVGNGQHRLPVRFKLDATGRLMDIKHNIVRGEVEVIINGTDRECGSDERWIFRGFVLGTYAWCGHVNGYFCTVDRTGWLEFKK